MTVTNQRTSSRLAGGPGQITGVFAPKSSRVVRQLLMRPFEPQTQREISRATGTDEGYTSKTVRRLEQAELLVRTSRGGLLPRDPDFMLDGWAGAYDFSEHIVIRGSITGMDKRALVEHVAGALEGSSMGYAATGLTAACLLDGADFDIAAFYVRSAPSAELLYEMSLREDFRTSNVWLVIPSDAGVFSGSESISGIRCVHPIQAYLDVLAFRDKSALAIARDLRRRHLPWNRKN